MDDFGSMDDFELLRAYANQHAESAFATLVDRYVNLVYSAALRQTHEPHAAEDITQAVFIILARRAASLLRGTILPGWLVRTTQYTAWDARRRERRRQNMEREAMRENPQPHQTEAAWEQIAPLLDEALVKLGAKDRDAIVLRFFEQRSFKQVGGAMGLSENTARMRVNRALEHLRRFVARRGRTLSALTLGSAIAANAVQAAPTALPASVTLAATTEGAGVTVSVAALVTAILKHLFWARIKAATVIGIPAMLIVGTATYVAPQVRERFETANLIRNGGFDEGLKHWAWYVHRSHGARADFTAEDVRSGKGRAAKISVADAARHDSVGFSQGPIAVQAGHKYRLSFRARSTARQPLRVQIAQTAPPWLFFGFRVSTEITPQWQTYRLTGRAMLTGDAGEVVFQCGGATGEIWLDDVRLHDLGL